MIAQLTGTVHRQQTGELILDVQGVGYNVYTPLTLWESLQDGTDHTLCILTYIREDRFELYGFASKADKSLFEIFISQSGIGPKLGLELCSVPRDMFGSAITHNDASLLTKVKGIGKKTAEKLLIELESISEKDPNIFHTSNTSQASHEYDTDAVSALATLGYDNSTILHILRELPPEVSTTEERVTAALKAM